MTSSLPPSAPPLRLSPKPPPPARAAGGQRRFSLLILLIAAAFSASCYIPPLPDRFALQIGDGTEPCLSLPGEPDTCHHIEGYYNAEHRLAVTRRPWPYTVAHEVCHAWQHQNILEQRSEDWPVRSDLYEWFLTPQGQSFLLMTGQAGDGYPLEDAAGTCAYRLLGLPMEGLDSGRQEWAEAWLR